MIKQMLLLHLERNFYPVSHFKKVFARMDAASRKTFPQCSFSPKCIVLLSRPPKLGPGRRLRRRDLQGVPDVMYKYISGMPRSTKMIQVPY
jgi:hypothetical protein